MKIEGRNAIMEALRSNKSIDKVLVAKGNSDGSARLLFAKLKEAKIKIQECDKKILDTESETGRHQGFIAFATDFVYSTIDDILSVAKEKEQPPFVVILDGLEDPHNLGSIIRSAECLGVHGIVIPKHRSVSVTDTVVRIAEGAIEYVKVAKVTNINSAIEELKEKGLWIMGADMSGEDITKTNLKGAIGLVIGSEGKGVSQLVKKNCDNLLRINMSGKINSLNASVAAAIAMFEISKNR